MAQLYFVRHGQSEWNVIHKICGRTDSPLTEPGHRQAIETGEKIVSMGIRADEILYSPLTRAADTARHISEITGIPMRVEPRLTEHCFGRWEGTDPYGDGFTKEKESFCMRIGGTGESMLRLAHRVYSLLDEITAQQDKTYILVSHTGISRVVESYFRNMTNTEFARFHIPNCDVRCYHY